MDFLDPKKKRAYARRLFIGYGLVGIVILAISVLLVFAAYGYNVDPRTGTITQNGLVFVDAHPESALVKLNGAEKGNTGQRLVLPAGSYTLELSRDLYRPWQRSFTLEGGTIERFVYPFLFPINSEPRDVLLYGSEPSFSTQSPDRQWLITGQPNNIQALELFDLNSDVPTSATLALPAGLLTATGDAHQLELVEWSTDNRHLVVKHIFTGGNELILIDREQPSSSQNLNKVFNQPLAELTLLDKKFDRYYLFDQTAGTLRTGELQSRQVTPLLDGVLEFRTHGDDVIVYVTNKGAAEGNVNVMIRQDDKDYVLRSLPAGPTYLLDLAKFDSKWYVAAGTSNDKRIYIYKNPVTLLNTFPLRKLIPVTTLRIEQPEYISFSNNARFIAVQAGSRFAVYDAETSRSHRYDTKLSLTQGYKAQWMDGHRLSVVSDQKAVVFDYDGMNLQTLNAASDKHRLFFNRDYEALYTIGPSVEVTDRTALTRTDLLLNQ